MSDYNKPRPTDPEAEAPRIAFDPERKRQADLARQRSIGEGMILIGIITLVMLAYVVFG